MQGSCSATRRQPTNFLPSKQYRYSVRKQKYVGEGTIQTLLRRGGRKGCQAEPGNSKQLWQFQHCSCSVSAALCDRRGKCVPHHFSELSDCLEWAAVSLRPGHPPLATRRAPCARGLSWPKAGFQRGVCPKVGIVKRAVPALWPHLAGLRAVSVGIEFDAINVLRSALNLPCYLFYYMLDIMQGIPVTPL